MDWGLGKRTGEAESQALLENAVLSPSAALDQGLTLVGSVMGTPGYMSPEQAAGEEVDERTDVFALGAILCEILTGEAPITGAGAINKIYATLQGRIELPGDRDPRVPRELNALTKSALETDKYQRLQSVSDFVTDLQHYLCGKPVTVYQYSVVESLMRWTKRHPAFLILSSTILLFTTLSTFFWAQKSLAEKTAREQTELRTDQQGAYEKGLEILSRLERLQGYRFQPLKKTESDENLYVFHIRRKIIEQVDLLNLLIKDNPRLPALHVLAAKAHLQLYQFDEGQTHVRAALESDPKNGAAWLLKGRLLSEALIVDLLGGASKSALAARGREISRCFENAKSEGVEIQQSHKVWLAIINDDDVQFQSLIRELVDKVDQSEVDYLRGARTFIQQEYIGEYAKESMEPFVACLKRCPRHYGARLMLSIACGNLGLSQLAIRYSELVLSIHPDFAEIWMNKGVDLMRLQRFSEAAVAIDRAIELKPNLAAAHMNRGNLAGQLDKLDRAHDCYFEALKHDPNLSHVYLNQARLWVRQSQFQEDEGAYKKFIELEPEDAYGHFGLGMLYSRMGRSRDVSIRHFKTAVECRPKYALAHYNLAVLFREKEDLETALDYALKAKKFNPNDAFAFLELGDIRRKMGDTEQALIELNVALSKDSQLSEGYRIRGLIIAKRGQYKEALSDFNKAVLLAPKEAENWANRAIVRSKLGNVQGAISDYSEALLIDAEQYENYVNRGLAYRKIGELKKAKRDFLQFLKFQPKHPMAKRLRAIVQTMP
ncbi:MAG: tetratricopeptide repeat protein, partial [Planctomycetota bacterium]|nr:tetratricopeptide repeat protein [Planctomycetota bacterium]